MPRTGTPRRPLQYARADVTYTENRIARLEAKLAEDYEKLVAQKAEVKRLVREEQLGTTTSQPSATA